MEEELQKTVKVLRAGGVIIYPTDTVWGIGCDAANEAAVRKIYSIKQRSEAKSMLVLIDSMVKLRSYVEEVPDIAFDLIELSDKPLTIVYEGGRNVAPSLITPEGTLGIRVTKDLFSKEICKRLKSPLVSTSANISGQPAPAVFFDIRESILKAANYVVNYRRNDTEFAPPSSIIQLGKGGVVKILRD